nr:E3 ubiquitin ligase SCF complex SKP1 subunit [Cryptomonas curvata]
MKNTKIFIKLVSKEKEPFDVGPEVILMSNFLKNIYKEFKNKKLQILVIPLFNIEAKVLAKIIEYCKFENMIFKKNNHINVEPYKNCSWTKDFLKINKHMIIPIIKAASYLDIENLLYCSTQILADSFLKKNAYQLSLYILS